MTRRKLTEGEKQALYEKRKAIAEENFKPYWFKPGQSGNPKGRPRLSEEEKKERADARKLLKAAAPTAAEKLIKMMENENSKKHFEACTDILDRTLGKASQPIGDEEGKIHIIFEGENGEKYSE